jgi:hypothetical protein
MYTFSGVCHCGAIRVKLELAKPAAETRVRACQCGFCRRHGTRTVADAEGLATIRIPSPTQLERYRFGHASADYLICRTCGVYVAAIQHEAGRLISVVNVAGLDVASATPSLMRARRSPIAAPGAARIGCPPFSILPINDARAPPREGRTCPPRS